MTGETDNQRLRRISVKAVLWLTEPTDPSTASISDQDLAALIDGRLSEAQRERVLSALDRDPAAYENWLAASAAIAAEPRKAPHPFRRALLPLLAAAAALLVAIGLWIGTQPSLESRIDLGYAMLQGSAGFDTRIDSGPLIVSRGGSDPVVDAAVSGFWAGRAALSEREPVPPGAAANSDSHQFGRWLALIDAGAKAVLPPSGTFWADQLEIARQLASTKAWEGDTLGAKTIQNAIAVLEDRLSPTPDRGNERWREALAGDVVMIKQRLGIADDLGIP